MGAEIDDRAREARVLHLRHGNEEMTGQRRHENLLFPRPDISGAARACKRGLAVLALALLPLLAGIEARAQSAASLPFDTDQGSVRLLAASPGVGDNENVTLGLEFRLAPHWKIYWRSPGDAGFPPQLDWSGSANLAGAAIAWPAPQRFSVLGLETMGYTDEVILPIAAKLAQPGKPLSLRLHLNYLTCDDICIPYETVLRLDLPAGAPPVGVPGYAALIEQFQTRVPGDGAAVGLRLAGASVDVGARPALLLRVAATPPLSDPDAFVEGADGVVFGRPRFEKAAAGETLLRLPAEGSRSTLAALAGKTLTVTLTDGMRALEAPVTPEPAAMAIDWAALLPMLALALAAGFILNFMPCVLPVLSLKLVSVVRHHGDAGAIRAGFLASAAGIVASFLALAAAAIVLRAAGMYVGWGVQFQSPVFLAGMAAILLLFAANLWGLFEIPLPRIIADAGGNGIVLGNFATGVLATFLATPCTAPLLGSALGFALASGPVEIVAIFAALGIGLAAPYLLVAALPAMVRLLPKPGAWMVELRRILGIALALSAIWLLWVLWAEIGTPPAQAAGSFWQPFDEAAISRLVGEGNTVFVDVTADWCLTCKVNERLVLGQAAVESRLTAPRTVAMRADWTRPDPAIARYLREFGRYGIPFNAVYGPAAPQGVALPEILTRDRVIEALDRAQAAFAPGRTGG